MAIPASTLVSVNPSVLNPGGTGLVLAGMFLTQTTSVPIGAPTSFANLTAVGNYFGTSSTEYLAAQTYFNGFDTSNIKPGLLWFAQYNTANVAAYVRGGAVTSLATVQTITAGTLSVTIDGTLKTTTTLNLSGATSLSNAATLIATALTLSGGQTCTYSSQFNAFVITSGTTGASSTITFGSGNAATTLGLLQANGAVLSQGAVAVASQSAFMNALVGFTNNWATFTTMWEPTNQIKQGFATWNSGQNTRYLYVCWETDATILQTPSSFTGTANWAKLNSISGTAFVYNDFYTAAFVCGIAAATDFTQLNGRVNYMFRTNSQMPQANVTDATSYANLIANGYSAYSTFATQANSNMLANGQVSGQFLWVDSYINAVWIAVGIQQAELTLLQQQKSIPYNPQGYTLISQAALDPILAAVNFGAIRPNVTPSASQIAQMNAAAGTRIDDVVSTRGWFFQVQPASSAVRAARQSPPCTLWYMDGQSVQQLNIGSVDVL